MSTSDELACYAVDEHSSRGRRYSEKPHPYRRDFERDRDRIIHSEAFRRLEGKTQVFSPGRDDIYRNRLTHSLEVAQIGRTAARMLNLNESLTEAICLGHDLGHSPFGHAGEKALEQIMIPFGGFEHNEQSLRIVDLLEHPYPHFQGLNLMYETRLGLAKHRGPYDKSKDESFAELNCSLEGQVANIADRIAYNCHDLEDGMRAGLIGPVQVTFIDIFSEAQLRIGAQKIRGPNIRRIRTAKAIIDILVSDCIETSRKSITSANLKSAKETMQNKADLITLSSDYVAGLEQLENFLLENFYRHESLIRIGEEVKKNLDVLFQTLCQSPRIMPTYYEELVESQGLQRTVCDYIAGMTDRYCLRMLDKLQV